MELSESVQRGLQSLADPSSFDRGSFQVLVDVSFRSLLSSHADPGVLDQPELKQIDQILLKQSHTAATTFILEAVKQNADKSTISSCLEDLTFSSERIAIFFSTYEMGPPTRGGWAVATRSTSTGGAQGLASRNVPVALTGTALIPSTTATAMQTTRNANPAKHIKASL